MYRLPVNRWRCKNSMAVAAIFFAEGKESSFFLRQEGDYNHQSLNGSNCFSLSHFSQIDEAVKSITTFLSSFFISSHVLGNNTKGCCSLSALSKLVRL